MRVFNRPRVSPTQLGCAARCAGAAAGTRPARRRLFLFFNRPLLRETPFDFYLISIGSKIIEALSRRGNLPSYYRVSTEGYKYLIPLGFLEAFWGLLGT